MLVRNSFRRHILVGTIGVLVTSSICGNSAASFTWNRDPSQAVAEAQRASKPLLIKVTADWCGYCVKMERETFRDPSVARHVQRCFVPLMIDADQNQELAQRLGATSLPTTLVVSPHLCVLARITGFKTADQLSQRLVQLCRHAPMRPAIQGEFAAQTRAPAMSPTTDKGPLSVYGQICPVSAREEGRFAPGNPAIATVIHGRRLLFASERHREMFHQDPSRYWPVADGNCIVSAFDESVARAGQLALGVIYDGRVWLFADLAHREMFRKSPGRYAWLAH